MLQTSSPRMSLLTAVEFITADPGGRIAFYKVCSVGARDIRDGMNQDDS
jgi:hypothetical protein